MIGQGRDRAKGLPRAAVWAIFGLLGLAVLGSGGLLLGWALGAGLSSLLVGLTLIVFGIALLIADLLLAGHGLPAAVGGLGLLIGVGLLFSGPGGFLAPVAPLLLGLALLFALGCGWIVYQAMEVQKQPASTGSETMIGQIAEVRNALDPTGFVFIEGALWRATSAVGSVPVGGQVRIIGVNGLTLSVTPLAGLPPAGEAMPANPAYSQAAPARSDDV